MNGSCDVPVSLTLSGGGIRAIAFHLGVLRLLAERRVLEDVCRISTVSGGSLLVGLMLQESKMRWPSSKEFFDSIYPALRQKLCQRSLQWGAARQLLRLWNWKYILYRANLLAMALKHEWRITASMDEVPARPEWSINGTTAETGKRFRFKKDSIGDYTLGYASSGDFSLAGALAVSAAFPGGFGPLRLDAATVTWRKRSNWDDPISAEQQTDIGYKHLHLYDGGVYDNLGLEPLFDAGKGIPKHPDELIVVSDAGAPLKTGFSLCALNPLRMKRVVDIMSDQSRALRVRTFAHYLQQKPMRGAYISIATPVSGSARCGSAAFAASFPTTLRRLTLEEFDALSGHGYKVALQVESKYGLVRSRNGEKGSGLRISS